MNARMMRNIGQKSGGTLRMILLPVLVLLIFIGCATTRTTSEPQGESQTHPHDLTDIRQAKKILIGKPPPQVVQTIGSPDREAGGGHWEWWTYENRFHDLVTHRTIREVTLVFRNGALVDITY